MPIVHYYYPVHLVVLDPPRQTELSLWSVNGTTHSRINCTSQKRRPEKHLGRPDTEKKRSRALMASRMLQYTHSGWPWTFPSAESLILRLSREMNWPRRETLCCILSDEFPLVPSSISTYGDANLSRDQIMKYLAPTCRKVHTSPSNPISTGHYRLCHQLLATATRYSSRC